jgi:hypothetical protein
MTDPSEGRKRNTGQASDGGEAAAADFNAEAESSARTAREFRQEFLSRTPFLTNPCKDGFAGEDGPGREKRNGAPGRNWPRRNSAPAGKPAESFLRHGQNGGGLEAMRLEGSTPRLTKSCLAAGYAAGPRDVNARKIF